MTRANGKDGPNGGRIPLPVLETRGGGGDASGLVETALRSRVRGDIRFGRHDRMLYATDASMYQVEPLGVVIPESVDDAAEAVRVCAEHGVPILPRGGGTSLAGQCTNRAVVIDTSRSCCAVSEVDTERGSCVVEPGVTVDDLNAQLAPTGWFFAPDPATSRHACVGGCIGNNAAGSRSVRYGRTSENLHGIDVCLADGRPGALLRRGRGAPMRARALAMGVADIVQRHAALIRERFPKTVRRNAGYGLDMVLAQLDAGVAPEDLDLTPLLCGSEGTLAYTLGATLKLHRVPATRGLAVVAFESVEDAIDAVPAILTTGPSAVELLDDMVIGLARANREYRRDVDLLPELPGGIVRAVLYVEYFADRDADLDGDELAERFEALRSVVPSPGVATHTDAKSMQRAWALRKAGEPLLHGIAGDRKPITFVEDNAVPVERLGEFVRRFREIVRRHGTQAAFYAHASVGVLHVRPLIDPHSPADRKIMQQIAVEVADLAKELGGVMSGEHGDGKLRSPLLERFYGPELVHAMREVKTLFDPRGLMNPGNIVEPLGAEALPRRIESISERTRLAPIGQERDVPPVWTHFAFADQHGFGGAVEMCNGAGVCRKRSGGDDVPLLSGHARRATLDPGAGQRATAGHHRAARRHGRCRGGPLRAPAARLERRRDAQDPRPLPELQGVQGRVPEQRGCRPAQGRVCRAELRRPGRTAAGREADGQCARSIASARSCRAWPTPSRRLRSARPSRAPARHRSPAESPPFARPLTRQVDREVARCPADLPARAGGRALRRLLHDVQRAWHRHGGGACAAGVRLQRRARRRRLLRACPDLDGVARRGLADDGPHRRTAHAVGSRRAGAGDRGRRALVPVGDLRRLARSPLAGTGRRCARNRRRDHQP
ncbi:MAG: FAD-binding oxidoreductase [Planctomycetota bacterium]|nr:MAG: FAD-binding oxidoreductase [Planctomycetota bacterium]